MVKILALLLAFLLVLSCATTPPPLMYRPLYDGEEIVIDIQQGIVIECCDCGLRHHVEYKIIDDKTISVKHWRMK